MFRLVLFDIDGTLIASGGAGEKAFARVCEHEFGVRDGTVGLHFAGRTDPAIVRDFFVKHGIAPSAENFRRFLDRYVFTLDHMLGQLHGRVLPGVTMMLRALQAAPRPPVVGLLTGNIQLGAQIKLSHYRLWQHFELGGFGDDHEDRNEIARVARERGEHRLGGRLRGEEVLVIGDTPRDVECARAIGARVLAVATGGYSLDQLAREQPCWAAPTLEEFPLGNLLGAG
ncbi:MAG: Phosphoglycolate phosphatase [Verrucomicrobiota bacterium]|jgi:phosphoglycolate phosphatase-like HAD superfamily hydrolase